MPSLRGLILFLAAASAIEAREHVDLNRAVKGSRVIELTEDNLAHAADLHAGGWQRALYRACIQQL